MARKRAGYNLSEELEMHWYLRGELVGRAEWAKKRIVNTARRLGEARLSSLLFRDQQLIF
jgi:hypothetical protein